MTEAQCALVRISAATATRRKDAIRDAFERARGVAENIRALHPDVEAWMVMEGYGKVLGRPGLDLRTRELCIVGLLAVLNTPKQLFSHLRGSVNVGATCQQVEQALEVALPYMQEAASGMAWKTWERVRKSQQPSRA